jgi:uncharacterized protein YndB with AHSA1/START domain
MSNANIITDGDKPAVRLERRVPDPPAVVWQSLTDREQLRAWFPCDVEVVGGVWEVGAAITFEFPPDVIDLTMAGEVLVVDEPKVLSYTWGDETLRFELSEGEGGGTLLVLVDELESAHAARNAAGWEDCLDKLEGVESLEGWQPRFEAYSAAFEPVLGAQEGPPEGYKGD